MLEGLTPPPNKSHKCLVREILDTLDQNDQAILTEALADKLTWPANTLSIALRDRGIQIADVTISKHRKQHCRCYRGQNA